MLLELLAETVENTREQKGEHHIRKRVARSGTNRCSADVTLARHLEKGVRMYRTQKSLCLGCHARCCHCRFFCQMLLELVHHIRV
jgi:hypothetical protein